MSWNHLRAMGLMVMAMVNLQAKGKTNLFHLARNHQTLQKPVMSRWSPLVPFQQLQFVSGLRLLPDPWCMEKIAGWPLDAQLKPLGDHKSQ